MASKSLGAPAPEWRDTASGVMLTVFSSHSSERRPTNKRQAALLNELAFDGVISALDLPRIRTFADMGWRRASVDDGRSGRLVVVARGHVGRQPIRGAFVKRIAMRGHGTAPPVAVGSSLTCSS